MKRILIAVFILISVVGFSQTPFLRGSPSILAMDAHEKGYLSLIVPVVADTSSYRGVDSLGALLYNKSDGFPYFRDTSSGTHKWTVFGRGSSIIDTANKALAATIEALPAVTYDNGTGGVGATLTADAIGVLPSIDGVTLPIGSKVLIKNQLSQEQNGFYLVTRSDAGTTFILTRADNANETSELYPELIAVSSGTINGGLIFQQITVAPVVGSDNLIYTLFTLGSSGVQSVTGLNTDNTDPLNPIVKISVDGVTVFGDGTPGDPLSAAGGGGGGSVVAFSSGNLTPLFTTSVATSTTTPAQTFAFVNVSPFKVFGRASGTGAPSYLTALDSNWIPTLHSKEFYDPRYLWTLTTTGTSGAATYSGNVLNIPQYGNGSFNSNIGSGYRLAVPNTNNIKTLHAGSNVAIDSVAFANELSISASDSASYHTVTQINDSTYTLNRPNGTFSTIVFHAGTPFVLTTTGTSGAATFTGGTLNIPIYGAGTLAATAIGYGSASNTLTGTADSISYDATNRKVTIVNSLVNGSTGINQLGLYLKNNGTATSSVTGLYSPAIGFTTSEWKSNATAASMNSSWAIKVKGVTAATAGQSQLEFSYVNGTVGTPTNDPSTAATLAFWSDGSLYSAGNMYTAGTAGNGTFFGANLNSTTTSGTPITLTSGNTAATYLAYNQSGQNIAKWYPTTGLYGLQNQGAIPADPADGSQMVIWQNTSYTGVGVVNNTSGTAAVTGTSTFFTNQFQPGDQIGFQAAGAETLTILSITDNTHLTLTGNSTANHTNVAYTVANAVTKKFNYFQNGNLSLVGKLSFASTITTGGTTGDQTINKPSGTVNIAASGTSVTVTNSLVTANSIVLAVIRTNDATAQIKSVVPSAGSFVINIVASAGEVSIGFIVHN